MVDMCLRGKCEPLPLSHAEGTWRPFACYMAKFAVVARKGNKSLIVGSIGKPISSRHRSKKVTDKDSKASVQKPNPVSTPVSKSMRGNRSTGTMPERMLAKIIWEAGYRGYRKNDKRVAGSPDLYFPKLRLAVMLNGCFWHRCPYCKLSIPKTNKDFWAQKFLKNKERDIRQRSLRTAAGIRSVVIWECKLKSKPQRVLERLSKIIREQESSVAEVNRRHIETKIS
jgi:DNA mismatch endonuclease (patch repair protein)